MFKQLIYKISKKFGMAGAIAALSTFQKKINEMEQNNVPLTYHNLNAILNQLIEGLE